MDDETREFVEQEIRDAFADLKEDLREDFVTRTQVIEILDDEDLLTTESFNDAFEERLQDVRLEI
jgi:hypothetical protein